jgi:hypothetical protein
MLVPVNNILSFLPQLKNYVRVLLEAKKFRCALLTSTNKMQTANMFLHKKSCFV